LSATSAHLNDRPVPELRQRGVHHVQIQQKLLTGRELDERDPEA
jgi:hypothetical protein